MGEVHRIRAFTERAVRVATFVDRPGFWQLEFLYHPSILGGGIWKALPDGSGDYHDADTIDAVLRLWAANGMPRFPDVAHGDDPGRAA